MDEFCPLLRQVTCNLIPLQFNTRRNPLYCNIGHIVKKNIIQSDILHDYAFWTIIVDYCLREDLESTVTVTPNVNTEEKFIGVKSDPFDGHKTGLSERDCKET